MKQVTTLVVDDSLPMRKAIVAMLESIPGCLVVGEAANGQEALERARALRPSLVVMDMHMPVMGGLEAARLLKRELPLTQVVIISTLLEPETHDVALRLGVLACVEKEKGMWNRLPAIVSGLYQSLASR